MAKLKHLYILIVFSTLVSCNKNEQTFYENGKLKSTYETNNSGQKHGIEKLYFPTGNLMSIKYYKKGVLVDSVVTYNSDSSLKSIIYQGKKKFVKNYRNGFILSSGYIDSKASPVGWWKFYDKNTLVYEEEHVVVLNKSIINQIRIYDNGQLDSTHSRIYDVEVPQQVYVGKPYPFKIHYNLGKETEKKNLLGKEYILFLTSSELNEGFSNINKIKLDTLYPTKQSAFFLTVGYRTSGRKHFRGVIERHTMVKEKSKLFVVKSQLFVDKEIQVPQN